MQTITQPCIQVPTSTASQGQECRVIRSTHAERNSASNKQSHNESLRTSTTSASDDDAANQFAPNETILQLVAQIPNHPLQKIAQKLIVDLPKTATENYFKTATSDDTASTTEATITSTTSKNRPSFSILDEVNSINSFFPSLLMLRPGHRRHFAHLFRSHSIGIERKSNARIRHPSKAMRRTLQCQRCRCRNHSSRIGIRTRIEPLET